MEDIKRYEFCIVARDGDMYCKGKKSGDFDVLDSKMNFKKKTFMQLLPPDVLESLYGKILDEDKLKLEIIKINELPFPIRRLKLQPTESKETFFIVDTKTNETIGDIWYDVLNGRWVHFSYQSKRYHKINS